MTSESPVPNVVLPVSFDGATLDIFSKFDSLPSTFELNADSFSCMLHKILAANLIPLQMTPLLRRELLGLQSNLAVSLKLLSNMEKISKSSQLIQANLAIR